MILEGTAISLTGKTVLVVDDNAPMRRLISTLLQVMGSPTILEAGSAQGALDILATTPVALLICDWRMNGMSGVELVHRARGGHGAANPLLPIIAVSAYSNEDLAREMYAAGANAVMTKPIGIATFIGIIRRLASRPNAFRQSGAWFGPERGTGSRPRAIN